MQSKSLKLSLVVLSCVAMAGASQAATVRCNVHAPLGFYKLLLFRVGDRNPTRVDVHVKIIGGRLYEFPNVPTGDWFVRAVLESDPYISGQGAAGHVTGWLPWTQTIPDCWVRP